MTSGLSGLTGKFYQVFKEMKVAPLCPTLCDPVDYTYSPWNSPGQNTEVGSLSLLQGIFPTQGSNPGPSALRVDSLPAEPQGKPRILEWVAYSFSSGSFQLGIELGSPALQGDYLPTELPEKPREEIIAVLQKLFQKI